MIRSISSQLFESRSQAVCVPVRIRTHLFDARTASVRTKHPGTSQARTLLTTVKVDLLRYRKKSFDEWDSEAAQVTVSAVYY